MPRLFDRVRRPLDTEERSSRNRRYNLRRLDTWIDPYPDVMGTLPEKMVYALLMEKNIEFNFQTFFRVKIDGLIDEWYRPDFIIPSIKVIIEVQGAYFHSRPEAIASDKFKYSLYDHLGYHVVYWWDYDIYERLHELFASEPKLAQYRGAYGGRKLTGHERNIDDSAGIRTLNQSRTDYGQRQPKRYTRSGSKKSRSIYSYATV